MIIYCDDVFIMIISVVLLSIYSYLGALWTIFIGVLMLTYYVLMKRENEYFPKNGIKHLKTYIPFVGNLFKVTLQREHFIEFIERMYKTYPEEKYFGVRNFSQPVVIVKDLEMIKQMTIKDFDHFMDHMGQVQPEVDPLFGSNLVALRGQKWRDMRATLSPAFTSSKMRGMFEFVNECGDEMAKFFLEEYTKQQSNDKVSDKTSVEIELKDTFTRYTNDVIATSAFGIKVNSLRDKNNVFYEMGKKATTFSGIQLLKFFIMVAFPKIVKYLHLTVFNAKISQFFRDLVNDSMKMREEKGIIRQDMIHLLMEAKKGSLKHDGSAPDTEKDAGFATVEESELGKQVIKRVWTDDEIIAQAIIFFFAGFDTSSNLLCFVAYELAKNPDIQKRLQEEVDEVMENSNGTLKYDNLQQMKYLDMVVSETLRLWPPGIAIDRLCVKSYTLPPSNPNSKTAQLNAGDGIWIPVFGIHRDPKYYENPEKFDPERFSDENKHKINPLAYLPFGVGPRNCIGSRFALMEVKSVLFNLLRNFDLVVTKKTAMTFEYNKNSFALVPAGGFWIGLRPRKTKRN